MARLNRLEEFGIVIENILPFAFKYYNENAISSFEENKKLCWEFLPNETSCISELDDWGFWTDSVRPHNPKRENFISNIDKIENDFALLMEEITEVYAESFYLIGVKENIDVKVNAIDEVTTCLHCWK